MPCFGCMPEYYGSNTLFQNAQLGKIVQATRKLPDGRYADLEDMFLLLAPDHIETLSKWHQLADSIAWATYMLKLDDDYNVSMNIGAVAGQTLPHLHVWLIKRQPNLPSSNKGLAQLIREADAQL